MDKKKNKIGAFRKMVKENRNILYGYFGKPTVDSWIYTDRIPTYDNACTISDVLQVLLTDIPYYRRQHVV